MNHFPNPHALTVLTLSCFLLAAASLGCATTSSRSTETASGENGASTTPTAEPGDPVVHTATDADRAYLASKSPIDAERVTLAVNGLSCPLCATNVDKQLQGVRGVSAAAIDFATGQIELDLTEPRPSPATLAHAIDRAGFTLVKISPR